MVSEATCYWVKDCLLAYVFLSDLVATFNDIDTVFGVSNLDTLEVVVNRSCSVAFD